MFNIKSIQNYISKLSNLTLNTETSKKLESIELFLGWLKRKHIIKGPEYLSLQNSIDSLRAEKLSEQKDIFKASLSPKNIYPTRPLSNNLNFKFLFVAVNVLIIFASVIYFQNYSLNNKSKVVLAKDTGRVLSYEGRLVDSEGKPITDKRDINFKIYDVSNGGLPLYAGGCVGQDGLIPEYNGKFTTLIGADCKMKKIPSSLFASSQDLYLGITIGSDKEMSPRQKIAKSSYAIEADKLKGMTLGAATGSIPYIDDNGRLLIDATSPTLKSSTGMFTLEGESITIQTLSKENGSIYLFPKENTLIASGNLGIGTLHPTAKLDVAGDASISGSLFFSTPQTQITQLNGGNITFTTSTAGEELSRPKMTIYNNGNIQIGQGEGQYKFNVSEDSRGDSIAALTNSSTEDNVDTNTLKLKLGTDKSGILSRFVQFYANSTSSNDGQAVGRIRLNNGNVAYETGAADFAEYFHINEPVTAGDIISVTENGKFKAKENESIVGVVSETAGFIGNASNESTHDTVVGLVGQIETNVSSINGEINVGDSISLSKIYGYGGKAIKSGEILGKALQSLKYSSDNFSNSNCPNDFKNNKDINGQSIICGKIVVLIQKGWYDRNINLTGHKIEIKNIGFLEDKNSNISLKTLTDFFQNQSYKISINTIDITNSLSAFEIIVAKIRTEYVHAQNIVVDGIIGTNKIIANDIKSTIIYTKNITAEQLNVMSAKIENLSARKINSPIILSDKVETQSVTTKSIQTTQDNLEINLEKDTSSSNPGQKQFADLVIKGFDNKTVASIDALGNASFSGVLSSQSVQTNQIDTSRLNSTEASISGNLYAKNITSDNIKSLENSVDALQKKVNSNNSSDNTFLESELHRIKDELTNIKNQKVVNPEYYQNIDNTELLTEQVPKTLADTLPKTQNIDELTVSSTANIFNASISNNLLAGQIFLKDDSILSLGSELKISALDRINFFNSSIIMSKDGTILTTGSLTAVGGVKTTSLQSIEKDLPIKFGSQSESPKDGKVRFMNSNNEEVSSIDEQGQGTFSKLSLKSNAALNSSVISPTDNYQKNGLYTSAIEAGKASAGVGLLPESVQEIVVYNDNITENSLVYLTSTSKNTAAISVSEKKTCKEDAVQNQVCKPYFKVIADKQNSINDLSFNWLVIN